MFETGQKVQLCMDGEPIRDAIISRVIKPHPHNGVKFYEVESIFDGMEQAIIVKGSQLLPNILDTGKMLKAAFINAISIDDFLLRVSDELQLDNKTALIAWQAMKVISLTGMKGEEAEYIKAYSQGFSASQSKCEYSNPYPMYATWGNSYERCEHFPDGDSLEHRAFENGYFDARSLSEHGEQ
ncbi:hypothetical protein GCM10007938_39790 [Vibrio zhanjiangensis]|uniref:Uncharacterized protein n=1 Tax=Vibrio zhanjiangensis TaxID=1046128 RepID=A0ABQ6F4N5_9VIBR|nr:hypothetical protein [Vibrio zhanjiangensis]GLT20196.1 hypothetical protein GCM10007938_39790 [Vibrio zhanjiangensis]